MSNPSKAKGTRAESKARDYLRGQGWTDCDRQPLRGTADQGDLIVCRKPLVIAEVKARKGSVSEAQIRAWMDETETEACNANADLAVLIVARHGINVAAWDAFMPVQDWAYITARGDYYTLSSKVTLRASLADWSDMTKALLP